jgi:hypothetical protein
MQEDFLFINVFYTDVTVVCWCRWFLDKSPRDNREAGVALQLGYVIGVHNATFPMRMLTTHLALLWCSCFLDGFYSCAMIY